MTSLVVCIDSSLVILKNQKLGLCSFIIGEWANNPLRSKLEEIYPLQMRQNYNGSQRSRMDLNKKFCLNAKDYCNLKGVLLKVQNWPLDFGVGRYRYSHVQKRIEKLVCM